MSSTKLPTYDELIKKHAGEKLCKLPEADRHAIWCALMGSSELWGRSVDSLIENIDRDLKEAKNRRHYGNS